MLTDLRIRDFALLSDVSITFAPGESAITGETGAGKSLFVLALAFLSGEKGEKRILREQGSTSVEARFLVDDPPLQQYLEEKGIAASSELLVRRQLKTNGSRQWINDTAVTVETLQTAMARLMDIHAQNAQGVLKNEKSYLPLIDTFIGDVAATRKKELRSLLRERDQWEKRLHSLSLSPEEVLREQDLLTYQLREIEDADLSHMDEEALQREYRSLTSAVDRLSLANQLAEGIEGDRGLRYGVQMVASGLDDLARKDPEMRGIRDMMWQIDAELDAVRHDLRNYRENVIVDPKRIAIIDDLFQLLQNLKRKYGDSIAEILAFEEEARRKKDELLHLDESRRLAEKEIAAIDKKIDALAEELHALRVDAAGKLEKRVALEMEEMNIKQVVFRIPFERLDRPGLNGVDRVNFTISTNPGEPLKPLSQVASGGEMSRFMLALKILWAEIARTPTLIFDEIDTGISGRTAQVVAEKLARLSTHHQVIVISHLPQIAALAEQHFQIKKEIRDNSTVSMMVELDKEGRVREQARLIGGVRITDLTRKSAMEMLEQAHRLKGEKESRNE